MPVRLVRWCVTTQAKDISDQEHRGRQALPPGAAASSLGLERFQVQADDGQHERDRQGLVGELDVTVDEARVGGVDHAGHHRPPMGNWERSR